MSELTTIENIKISELDALVKTIVGQTGIHDPIKAIELVISGEFIVSEKPRSWKKRNGIISFSVTSDGTTGDQWITRLHNKGCYINDNVTNISRCITQCTKILSAGSFEATSGITYKIAVITNNDYSKNITRDLAYKMASELGYSIPGAEIACLIRDKFSNRELRAMGLNYITIMHNPFKVNGGENGSESVYLVVDGSKPGESRLTASYVNHNWPLSLVNGLAFVVSSTPVDSTNT